ncbi:MAG: TolC family protein [Chitinophagales bacterium]
MNKRKPGWAIAIGLTAFNFLHAQETKPVTLNEAIELSIKNSKQLKSSQAKIEEATAILKQSVQKRLPDVNVTGSYLRLSSGNIDLKTKSNNNSGGSQGSTPKIDQAVYGLINASLPIYAGGRISYGIESSKYLEQAAELDAENDKDEVIQNTIEAFSNLFKAGSAVRLVKENLAQSQERTRELSNLEKNGLLARNDLLKAELQTSNTELNLLDAENNLQLANVNMDLMLGLPINATLVLDTTGIEKKNDTRTFEDFLQAALTNRKDAAALDYRKKAAETGVKSIKGEKFPSLQLTGGYIAADIPKFLSITNTVNIGVGVSYNIGSLWKNKAKELEAQARVSELSAGEAMINDNIQRQVSSDYLSLVSRRKKIEVYAKAMEQANENYRIIKNKFDNNLATTSDLLDADAAKLQANLAFTLTKADAFVAYHKLLQTAGLLANEIKK